MILAGCATAKPIPLPNGHMGFTVDNCDSQAECYKKAFEACQGHAYDVVNSGSEQVGGISGAGGVVTGYSVPQYSMQIQCKD